MASAATTTVRPYAPSWVDRFSRFVDRSRVPAWVVYLGLALVSIPIFAAADVVSADFPLVTYLPFHAFVAALPALTLWLINHLDRSAERALEQAAPVLAADADQIARLRYELTTMPFWPVLILTIAGPLSVPLVLFGIFSLDPADNFLTVLGLSRTSPSMAVFVMFMSLSYAAGLIFLYHAWRQLRLVNRIYERHVVLDLARLGPLYSFARVSALTAAGIQIQAVLWIVTNPAAGGAFLPIAFLVSLTLVSAVIFMVPLWGIHRRIADEKGDRLTDNARGRETLMSELRRGVETHDLARATQIKDALLAYDVEAKALAGTRTWPWEPETLRLLLTAVLLPTALFILQYVLRLVLPA